MTFLLASYKNEHQTNALRLCNYFCIFFVFTYFSSYSLQLLRILSVSLIFRYSAQILLENALNILPAECSPQKSLLLLEILPAEFIQA